MKTEYQYLTIEKTENGLIISLTDEGKEKISEEDISEYSFYQFFEDINCNSELVFHGNLGNSGLGLTDAPGITDGFYLNDDGRDFITTFEDSKIYWFPDYMVLNFTEELKNKNQVIFQLA